jgi:hypothetical protein
MLETGAQIKIKVNLKVIIDHVYAPIGVTTRLKILQRQTGCYVNFIHLNAFKNPLHVYSISYTNSDDLLS